MMTLAGILSLGCGLALMRYPLQPAELIATSIVIDATLAPLTAVIAARRGRSPWMWGVIGFPFGMWSLAYVLLVRARASSGGSEYPPTSDAA